MFLHLGGKIIKRHEEKRTASLGCTVSELPFVSGKGNLLLNRIMWKAKQPPGQTKLINNLCWKETMFWPSVRINPSFSYCFSLFLYNRISISSRFHGGVPLHSFLPFLLTLFLNYFQHFLKRIFLLLSVERSILWKNK